MQVQVFCIVKSAVFSGLSKTTDESSEERVKISDHRKIIYSSIVATSYSWKLLATPTNDQFAIINHRQPVVNGEH
jgi:hypothetical protein